MGDLRQPRPSTFLREISIEYSYQDLTSATQNWSPSRQLGSGSYGAVYKGELEDGSEVAIKALNLAALGQQSETAGFEDEVRMLSKFRHPKLVTLLGWGKKDSLRYLVYELLQGGDAFQRLQKAKVPPPQGKLFMWHERLSVCLDAATGLSHMHNSKPKAFHRDIKSANILLDKHGTAKMADFGLSCTAKTSQPTDLHVTVKTISGTPGYACPIYARTGRVTEGSEVYSFGMVMLELMTNQAPATADPRKPGGIAYPIADTVAPQQPPALERAMQYLDQAAQWPPALARELATMALRCVNAREESQRPLFVEIVRALRSMTERFPKEAAPSPAQVLPPSFSSALPQIPGNVMGAQGPQAAGARTPIGGAQQAYQQPQQQPQNRFAMQQPQQPQQQAAMPAAASRPPIAAAADPSRGAAGRGSAQQASSDADHAPEAMYCLDLEKASTLNVAMLPAEQRRLPITPSKGEGGLLTFTVGRHHQTDLFEAWVPSEAMRNCISRTAFEVTFSALTGENVQLLARGANPIAVDGAQASVGRGIPLRVGSKVVFTNPSQPDDILTLRFNRMTQPMPVVNSKPKEPMVKPVWKVECTHAEGHTATTLASLPIEQRAFAFQNGTVHIGRQHQAKVFESLLRNSQQCLAFISRTHAEMEAQPGRGVSITNLSGNPLWIDGEQLGKGKSAPVGQDQTISFARLEGADHVHFLRLQLRFVEGKDLPAACFSQEASKAPPGRPDAEPQVLPATTPPAREPGGGLPFRPQPRAEVPSPSSPDSPGSPPRQQRPPSMEEAPRPQPKAKAKAGAAGGALPAGANDTNGMVLLELGGEGTRSDLLVEQRRVGPVSLASEPLIIGRRHQREFHEQCIQDKACLQFVSRDHLEIRLVGSAYQLKALTANPIWRERLGCEPVELAQHETVGLEFGDRIVLGTGTSQTNTSEASKKLHWLFMRPGAEIARPASRSYAETASSSGFGGNTPPSPGGHGPRVSDPPAWSRGGAGGGDIGGRPWEPMLPPAAETVPQRGRGLDMHSPAGPRLLPDDDEGIPQFGGGVGAAAMQPRSAGGMLRPPVQLDDLPSY